VPRGHHQIFNNTVQSDERSDNTFEGLLKAKSSSFFRNRQLTASVNKKQNFERISKIRDQFDKLNQVNLLDAKDERRTHQTSVRLAQSSHIKERKESRSKSLLGTQEMAIFDSLIHTKSEAIAIIGGNSEE